MPAPTTTPREQFMSTPLVPELAAAGAASKIEHAETLSYEPQPRRQFVIRQKFLITPPQAAADTHAHPIELILTLQRSQLAGERQSRWLVQSYESPQLPAEEAHVH